MNEPTSSAPTMRVSWSGGCRMRGARSCAGGPRPPHRGRSPSAPSSRRGPTPRRASPGGFPAPPPPPAAARRVPVDRRAVVLRVPDAARRVVVRRAPEAAVRRVLRPDAVRRALVVDRLAVARLRVGVFLAAVDLPAALRLRVAAAFFAAAERDVLL